MDRSSHGIPSGSAFSQYVIQQIKEGESQGFTVITMGDFNLNPSIYYQSAELGSRLPKHFKLIDYLSNNDYIDQFPSDDMGKPFATFYNALGVLTSHIDLIWYPDSLLRLDFCFNQVWRLPSFIDSDVAHGSLDHCCMIVYFTKHLFVGSLPTHRIKQKKEWRTIFNLGAATTDDWQSYASTSSSELLTASFIFQ